MNEFFKKCHQLEDLSLIIKADDNFNENCLKDLPETISYFHLNLKDEESYESKIYSLEKCMQHLSLGGGKNLEFLRVNSDGTKTGDEKLVDFTPRQAFDYISRLSNLRGLNISVRNDEIESFRQHFLQIKDMEKLETLTIRILPSIRTTPLLKTNGILNIIRNAKFKNTLKRFKLIDAQLKSTAFNRMIKSHKNLESLQLIDCTVDEEDIDLIVETIIKMKKLNELTVEIHNSDDENYNFKNLSLQKLQHILENCKYLEYFNLETIWNKKQTNILKEIAQNKYIICQINFDSINDD